MILKRNGYKYATIGFTVGEMLGCEIVGEEASEEKEEGIEDEISYALLSALLGEVQFIKDGDTIVGVEFEGWAWRTNV